jgi:hypothetical protein
MRAKFEAQVEADLERGEIRSKKEIYGIWELERGKILVDGGIIGTPQ